MEIKKRSRSSLRRIRGCFNLRGKEERNIRLEVRRKPGALGKNCADEEDEDDTEDEKMLLDEVGMVARS